MLQAQRSPHARSAPSTPRTPGDKTDYRGEGVARIPISAEAAEVEGRQIRVAVNFGSSHAVLTPVETDRVESLQAAILLRFPDLRNQHFVVKYEDDEGDWITVSSTSDLQQALEFFEDANDGEEVKSEPSLRPTLQLVINVVQPYICTDSARQSPQYTVLDDDDSDDAVSVQNNEKGRSKFNAKAKGEETSVPEVLYNAVLEIPKPVYQKCPIARLFRHLVKSLMVKASPHNILKASSDDLTRIQPKAIETFHKSREWNRKDTKEIGTLDRGMPERTISPSALPWLRSMGFNDDEEIKSALEATGGDITKAVERLLDTNRRESS
mmetsp:Transcript_25312/g.60966  ORF Transcript_25312/g.60966 Transcript_25312/m.60966 type:complete len:324 (-) Transcript_25312:381-1352(-)|eukprot:CAMPEP_0114526658 /NCGR_PEP_ID=MMETSP0109-20121206/23150_1 /TAXON_ID=29199 /ORGANISM="Chlorarachnion reptans, Strain CCCM449" /LENGTH=323 /DNA_ID=CAMNT_0001708471 /DNA_START=219 /DNA_END=1190 /DNA_ORIENTATION=+